MDLPVIVCAGLQHVQENRLEEPDGEAEPKIYGTRPNPAEQIRYLPGRP
jgi:hypothetical protein